MAATNGSKVNRAKKVTRHKPSAPKYRTEKEGRLLAMDFIDMVEKRKGAAADAGSAYPYDISYEPGEEITLYRTGPQWDGVYQVLSRLMMDGNDEALKGFASIITDALNAGFGISGETYRANEAAGVYRDFGTPGTAYPKPRNQAARRRRAEMKAEEERVAASRSSFKITAQESAAVEEFLSAHGSVRRAALAIAEKSFASIAKSDRKAALALAAISRDLDQNAGRYWLIAAYIQSAAENIRAAILARKDGRELLRAKA
jgi:hypothetical protein